AAALYRRHHLHRVETDMAGVGLTPGRSMAAENIRDLQNRARPARCALGGWVVTLTLQRDMLQRAHDLTNRLGGDPRIERRVLEFGVTEQHLDHPNVGIVLEQMGGKAMS